MARIDGAGRADLFTLDPEAILIPDQGALRDERADLPFDESLVRSIMFQGVLQPVLVRKNGPAIEVVAGRQRVKAAREANRRLAEQGKMPVKVPAILKHGQDADLFAMLISENELRRNDDPILKAQKARRLLDMGYGAADIAVVFGVAEVTIQNWLGLNDLAPEVQSAVSSGELSVGAAKAFTGLRRDEQPAALDRMREGTMRGQGKITASKARQTVQGKPEKAIRTKREIKAMLARFDNAVLDTAPDYADGFMCCLEWVLNEKGDGYLAELVPHDVRDGGTE